MATEQVFASRGARRQLSDLPLFSKGPQVQIEQEPRGSIVARLCHGDLWGDASSLLAEILSDHAEAAPTRDEPATDGISAGKNTYTYDAHTYHTKVPPQGIAEVLRQYLPQGGLVLDPFAGSGMTGVAAQILGLDAILNELSPAACLIADRFTQRYDPLNVAVGVEALCASLADLRRQLYTTRCRTCNKGTEILFTVWSYCVRCTACDHEFVLWDHCRRYGTTVREHKILSEFPCPACSTVLRKSRLRRTLAVPVLLGYRCCSKKQEEHPLSDDDRALLDRLEMWAPLQDGFIPKTELPDGVNLCQPKRHGLTSVDRFYTHRNLAAMSALWRAIHCVKDDELAGFLAFVFTSLYQRVTKLSEFRFWGGSGNTARFNVPFIYNEANVFVTFERKARTIRDHLETTARAYQGRTVVRTGSATDLSMLPNSSIDLIFTDPPFGANINYSEMNILWEAWLGCFTNTTNEAIVNRFQGKDVSRYGQLMTDSFKECQRVLRQGHWMIVVFMNSSHAVWDEIRNAIIGAGFVLERVDVFDKQHGTFKQFVSENTAGSDLLLHCRKQEIRVPVASGHGRISSGTLVRRFLGARGGRIPSLSYLHVRRNEEVDYRLLYSEFLAQQLTDNGSLLDFATFREEVARTLDQGRGKSS